VPREIEFIDALPTTASGKIRRDELRERPVVGRPLWEAAPTAAIVETPEPVAAVPEPTFVPTPQVEPVVETFAEPVVEPVAEVAFSSPAPVQLPVTPEPAPEASVVTPEADTAVARPDSETPAPTVHFDPLHEPVVEPIAEAPAVADVPADAEAPRPRDRVRAGNARRAGAGPYPSRAQTCSSKPPSRSPADRRVVEPFAEPESVAMAAPEPAPVVEQEPAPLPEYIVPPSSTPEPVAVARPEPEPEPEEEPDLGPLPDYIVDPDRPRPLEPVPTPSLHQPEVFDLRR
jgi:hypothetical protein